MIIFTDAKVINRNTREVVRTVWAVNIDTDPEFESVVKQLEDGFVIESTDTSSTYALREIDPIQFINIGIDGRLSNEKKTLNPTSIDVRVPRRNVEQFEHIKLEDDKAKWFKETEGQWAYHDATPLDIENFLQRYISDSAIITKQTVKSVGQDVASKIANMKESDIIKLLNLPDELPDKFNGGMVIKRSNDSFTYAEPESLVSFVGNQLRAFGTPQTSITIDGVGRLRHGIFTEVRDYSALEEGLYRKLPGVSALQQVVVDDNGIYQGRNGDLVYVTTIDRNKLLFCKNGELPSIFTTKGYVVYGYDNNKLVQLPLTVDMTYTYKGGGRFDEVIGQCPTFQSGGVYIERKTINSGKQWYRLDEPPLYTDPYVSKRGGPMKLTNIQAAWVGDDRPILYFTHPFGDPLGKYPKDSSVNQPLSWLLQGGGTFEVSLHGTAGAPGRPWDYNSWNVIYGIRKISSAIMEQGNTYSKDEDGYMITVETHTEPCKIGPFEPGKFYQYYPVVDGASLMESKIETDQRDDFIDLDIEERKLYLYNGDALNYAEFDNPIMVNFGSYEPFDCPEYPQEPPRGKPGLLYHFNPEGELFVAEYEDPIVVIDGHVKHYNCPQAPSAEGQTGLLYQLNEQGGYDKANSPLPITIKEGVPLEFTCPTSDDRNNEARGNGSHLLAAALMGAGIKEIISNDLVTEDQVEDEIELDK